jgi:galactokinase
VVSENRRVLQFVVGLVEADAEVVGETMAASHASLRDDYQVSCVELDALVTFATDSGLAIGSRLTGAGFGGCTVNIVPTRQVESFVAEVQRRFRVRFGRVPEAYALSPAAGAAHGRLDI